MARVVLSDMGGGGCGYGNEVCVSRGLGCVAFGGFWAVLEYKSCCLLKHVFVDIPKLVVVVPR